MKKMNMCATLARPRVSRCVSVCVHAPVVRLAHVRSQKLAPTSRACSDWKCSAALAWLRQGGMPAWAARAAALARGAFRRGGSPSAARAAEFVRGCAAPLCTFRRGGSPPAAYGAVSAGRSAPMRVCTCNGVSSSCRSSLAIFTSRGAGEGVATPSCTRAELSSL